MSHCSLYPIVSHHQSIKPTQLMLTAQDLRVKFTYHLNTIFTLSMGTNFSATPNAAPFTVLNAFCIAIMQLKSSIILVNEAVVKVHSFLKFPQPEVRTPLFVVLLPSVQKFNFCYPAVNIKTSLIGWY